MPWSDWSFFRLWATANVTAIADQTAALVEERAWSLVERRIMWLSHRELRGYVRARTRPLLPQIIKEFPASLQIIKSHPRFIDVLNDRLVQRLLNRAEMARSHSMLRTAA
jgi:hypothetical protein